MERKKEIRYEKRIPGNILKRGGKMNLKKKSENMVVGFAFVVLLYYAVQFGKGLARHWMFIYIALIVLLSTITLMFVFDTVGDSIIRLVRKKPKYQLGQK